MGEINVNLNLISKQKALELSNSIQGEPTENRLLIAIPNGETRSKGGLLVPTTVKEGVPRKGVVVKLGPIDETYSFYSKQISVGTVVTYGMYAGKTLQIDLPEPLEGQEFTILSLNEVLFVEPNNY